MRRPPAVAGHFYSARPEILQRDVEQALQVVEAPVAALGCVVPHAGLVYSGHVAGAVFSQLVLPPSVILLGPSHSGYGPPLAIMSEGEWVTPLGDVPIDTALARSLREACGLLEEDPTAHRREHSLEVQLPFLQVRAPNIRVVPIVVAGASYEHLEQLGQGLAAVVAATESRPLLIASTDLNHYEPESRGRLKDQKAIDRILALDAPGLEETVRRERITMCGFRPTIAALVALRLLGATSAELIRYATSGDITGDRSSVVGYAGIVIR